ncbi:MAG: hypothetical protein V2I51_08600 [Anderseniella sp.]|jgi:hypothetical protein|nr:hypothetical protein [Anderseniella sp.]
MKRLLSVIAVSAWLCSPAFASQCPSDMSKIDAAMQTAQLSDEEKAKVTELRAKGEELHAAGNHAESVETLGEAKTILGIE